jgi:hypothetical protein
VGIDSSEPNASPVGRKRWLWQDLVVGLLLFAATAGVVIWQNSRLAVLWDLSYILENSYRISLGDIPYRDFPFPYAPLTFLIQAALIKLTGRVFWHHVAYCAIAGGLASVVTWRILLNLFREVVSGARLPAFFLSLPLVVLGVYCIYPHPFYDCDCTFAMLVGVLLLQRLERKHFPSWSAFLTGVTLVIPLFIKQNTGGAFLASVIVALAALVLVELWRRQPIRGFILVIAGAAVALGVALALIHYTTGLGNYWRWTVQFAAARRTPARAEMLAIYEDKSLVWSIPLFAAGALLCWFSRRGKGVLAALSALLMSAPFAWPMIYLIRDPDSSERAERLVALWPFVLILAFVFTVVSFRRGASVTRMLPLILIGAVQGAFMSQQLWGSTYAIWPLLMILVASMISALGKLAKELPALVTMPLASVIAVSLLVSGAFYVWSHERLDYANLSDGEMARSTLPPLKGLSMRGQWIPGFEELVGYAEREIPGDDGLLMIPGEDLFYYATGRRPRFPVLMFDHTVNPYSPEEILNLCRERNIRWLIVKQDLQLEEDQVDSDKDALLDLLEQDFKQVESLDNYDIYRRQTLEDKDDDEDDQDSGPANQVPRSNP